MEKDRVCWKRRQGPGPQSERFARPWRQVQVVVGEPSVKLYCPYCGIANVAEATVCHACGSALLPDVPTASATPDFAPPDPGWGVNAPQGYGPPATWAPPPYQGPQTGSSNNAPGPYAGNYGPAPAAYAAPLSPRLEPTGPYNGAYPANYVPVPSGGPWNPPPYTGQALPPAGMPYPPPYGAAPGTQYPAAYASGTPGAYPPAPPGYYPVPAGNGYGGVGSPQAPYSLVPSSSLPLADPGTRLGAFVLDSVAVAIPWFMLIGLATATASEAMVGLATLAMFFGPALYFIACWASGGQTLGARALGLKVVRSDGSNVGVGSAIARCIGLYLCLCMLVPGMFGLMYMLWDDKKQGLHDKMGDTIVIHR